MRSDFIRNALSTFLFLISILLGGLTIILLIRKIFELASDYSFLKLVEFTFLVVYTCNFFIVTVKLILLLESSGSTPFIFDNVKRLKTMGYCLLFNSIYDCVMDFRLNLDANIRIFGTENGGISGPMIVCLLAALMCFVMAEIFDKAIKIKEEQDLTI
ncbi:DUF2975 domain-containing protein [Romboutsia weinsteinii]|uniref:DUF2975 domain-containing protein n=1 Tax=Romboutsia weinsteinii TaxID=2020949 RepID=A0A371J5X1_9FIRM|nr:DUF2975 domain-containing protein [Romboutsia weinsteinii]RDY28145.1 DUF2975 domain-containing protein [Romboutsia weinsteinii]